MSTVRTIQLVSLAIGLFGYFYYDLPNCWWYIGHPNCQPYGPDRNIANAKVSILTRGAGGSPCSGVFLTFHNKSIKTMAFAAHYVRERRCLLPPQEVRPDETALLLENDFCEPRRWQRKRTYLEATWRDGSKPTGTARS